MSHINLEVSDRDSVVRALRSENADHRERWAGWIELQDVVKSVRTPAFLLLTWGIATCLSIWTAILIGISLNIWQWDHYTIAIWLRLVWIIPLMAFVYPLGFFLAAFLFILTRNEWRGSRVQPASKIQQLEQELGIGSENA